MFQFDVEAGDYVFHLFQASFRIVSHSRDSMSRWVGHRTCIISLCFIVALVAGPVALAAPLIVEAEAIVLDSTLPERTRVGELTFLNGFELRSRDARFGGLSGLALDPTGKILYAVSDHGFGLSARLFHDSEGRLIYIDAWDIVPLLTPAGRIVSHQQRDAEALVREQDGSFLVAFEHVHRVWRYPPSVPAFTARPEPLAQPHELSQAPANRGLEAITRLSHGPLLVLTEGFKNPDRSYKGWLIEQEHIASLSYVPTDGYLPTDLGTLDSGDVLLLERRYRLISGAAVRLRRITRDRVRAGARLQGIELARLRRPLAVDNFEGLAVYEGSKVGTLLYVVSDDNYNPFQRTLLLQFRLAPRR